MNSYLNGPIVLARANEEIVFSALLKIYKKLYLQGNRLSKWFKKMSGQSAAIVGFVCRDGIVLNS